MPKLLIIGLILFFQAFAWAADSEHSQYLVSIKAHSPKGKKKEGFGFIFKHDEDYFIRTASSVIFGDPKTAIFKINDFELPIEEGESLVDNDIDDAIVKIKKNPSNTILLSRFALGYYSDLWQRIIAYDDKVSEAKGKSQTFSFEVGGRGVVLGQQNQKKSRVDGSLVSEPSGGDKYRDPNVSINQYFYLPETIVDPKSSGYPLTLSKMYCPLDKESGFKSGRCEHYTYVVVGHTVVRQGNPKPKFVRYAGTRLAKKFLEEKKKGSTSATTFKEFGMNVYRYRVVEKNGVQSLTAEYVSEPLPNVRATLGRNHIFEAGGGEVADGSFSECRRWRSFEHCVDQSVLAISEKTMPGMFYHGKHIVAFEAMLYGQKISLKADWENMVFYEQLLEKATPSERAEFSPVDFSVRDIHRLIYSKNFSSLTNTPANCKISLLPGGVVVDIVELRIGPSIALTETITLNEKGFPLTNGFSRFGPRWIFDISGIYSTSSSAFKDTTSPTNPFENNFMFYAGYRFVQVKFSSDIYNIGWTPLRCELVGYKYR